MQPAVSKQPAAAAAAASHAGQALELADDDAGEPADKPANSQTSPSRSPSRTTSSTSTKSTSSPARQASTGTIKPTAPSTSDRERTPTDSNTNTPTPQPQPQAPAPVRERSTTSSSIKRLFRSASGSGSAEDKKSAVAPLTSSNSNGGYFPADTSSTGAISAAAVGAALKGPSSSSSAGSKTPRGDPTPSQPSSTTTTATTMALSTSRSTSVSPASTLPTPPSEHAYDYTHSPPSMATTAVSNAPASRPPSIAPSSKAGSRRSSFNAPAPPSRAGSESGATGTGKFTLKDLLANGPKLARKPSASSRKSDASSDHGDRHGGGGGKSDYGDARSTTTSLLKKYGVCEKIAIGKGATSVVRLAHKWDRSEEKLYAVKEFRKRRKNETEKEYVKKLTAEFCISSTLHHINIVETVDLVQDEQHHWCEVMEYCPGGDLYAAIKKGQMSASEIECCFKQLLVGVGYLHSQGVAHRDIKPENLFFDTRGHLKIGDYGASTVYRLPWEATVHMSTGLCGSEPYIAPEQFLRKPYDARLVDIWAVGVVYYCLLFQELPWRVAQQSDPLFAAYSQACAAAPFKPLNNASAAPSTKSTGGSSTTSSSASSTASLPSSSNSSSHSTANGERDGGKGYASFVFPPTIQNIEPREARPLLRRILEPDPKKRASIEEIMAYEWMRSIEVCTEVIKEGGTPRHGHANIRAALGQVVQVERD